MPYWFKALTVTCRTLCNVRSVCVKEMFHLWVQPWKHLDCIKVNGSSSACKAITHGCSCHSVGCSWRCVRSEHNQQLTDNRIWRGTWIFIAVIHTLLSRTILIFTVAATYSWICSEMLSRAQALHWKYTKIMANALYVPDWPVSIFAHQFWATDVLTPDGRHLFQHKVQ